MRHDQAAPPISARENRRPEYVTAQAYRDITRWCPCVMRGPSKIDGDQAYSLLACAMWNGGKLGRSFSAH